jgi:stage IV sporulation protein FB
MNWSWKIGTLFRIPVRLHVTMVAFPIIAFSWVDGSGPVQLLAAAGLTLLLFGSIVAHELGHALTARRFGVHTLDIVLTPIGGMARIANMPSRPRHEIIIAVAGPLVSLALAGAAFVTGIVVLVVPAIPEAVLQGLGVLTWINLMLALFNLIPALPMDGGRILRGFLASRGDFLTATRKAARVGRVIAVAGGILAVLYLDEPFTAVLIAIFIYIAAGAEERMALLREVQRRAAEESEGPFPGGPPTGGAGPRIHTWTWRAGGPPPAEPPTGPVITGGKARIVSRRDTGDR